jgi:plastocyanin
MRKLALVTTLLVLIAAVPAGEASGRHVKVGDNYYRARTVHVSKGSTVTWRWAGRRRHDVYFTHGHIARCKSRRHGSCTRRFRRRGTFTYVCTLHGNMAGRVVVR